MSRKYGSTSIPYDPLGRWLSESVEESPWSEFTMISEGERLKRVKTSIDRFEGRPEGRLEGRLSSSKPIRHAGSELQAGIGAQFPSSQPRQTPFSIGKQLQQQRSLPCERRERNADAATSPGWVPSIKPSLDPVTAQLSPEERMTQLQQRSSTPHERPIPSAEGVTSSDSVPSPSSDLIPAQFTSEEDRGRSLSKPNINHLSRRKNDVSRSAIPSSREGTTEEKQSCDSRASNNNGKDGESSVYNQETESPVLASLQAMNDGSEGKGQQIRSYGARQAKVNDQENDSKNDRSSSVESLSKSEVSLKEYFHPTKDSIDTLITDPPTPPIITRYANDLDSHQNAFYTILHAYVGHQCGANDCHEADKNGGISSGRYSRKTTGSSLAKRARPSSTGGSHRGDDQSDISDGDDRQRNQKRRKASQHPQLPGRRFACPFHKYDPGLYELCREWSCVTIENVKRHVLGIKHRTFFQMSPDKERSIQAIPPSRTGTEERWHVIYRSSFDVANDSNYNKPSPYVEETMTSAPPPGRVRQFSLPLPTQDLTVALPTQTTTHARSNINPDASAYADEIQRLTEQYNQLYMEVSLTREQERRNLQATQSRLLALDFGELQLRRDLNYNLENLQTGMAQGLPLHVQLRRVPLVVTTSVESQPGADLSLEIPAPSQVSVQGFLENDGGQPEHEDNYAPTEAQPSIANDSGYGTMPPEDHCSCGIDDASWCLGCAKWLNLPEDLLA